MCNVGLRQALIEHVGRARLREGVSGQANPATEMGAVDARKRVSQAPAQRVLLWHISLLVQYFPRLFGIPKGHLDFFFPPSSSRFWATGLKHQPAATRRSDPVHQRWGSEPRRCSALLSGRTLGDTGRPSGSRRQSQPCPGRWQPSRRCWKYQRPGAATGWPPAHRTSRGRPLSSPAGLGAAGKG